MKISSEKFGIVPVELTDKNFNEIAEKLAVSITTKIHEVEQDIKEAKRLTNKADDIDTKKYTVRFWKNNENRDRKTDLIVEADILRDKAISNLADLQQEAIKLVTIQYQLSNGLITYFSSALKGQLKDANGKIIELSENGTEIINHIIQQAQQYAIEQLENKQTRSVVQQTIIQVQQINGEIAYLNTQIRKYQKQNELMLKLQKKANIAITVAIIAILLTIAVLAWSFLK